MNKIQILSSLDALFEKNKAFSPYGMRIDESYIHINYTYGNVFFEVCMSNTHLHIDFIEDENDEEVIMYRFNIFFEEATVNHFIKDIETFIVNCIHKNTGWQFYKRKGRVKCRPVTEYDIDMASNNDHKFSISKEDRENGSPKYGDMLATDGISIWLICEEFFKQNYE